MTFFLIGFMGSGKTHWGKIWAEVYGLNFIDLDEVIEIKEGKTIATVFENDGEAYFRQTEAATLRSFDGAENVIIACGGGTPCFLGNMQWMNEHGTTIYLSSTAPEIFKRVLSKQEKRPLISKMNEEELLFFIEQKLNERAPFYAAATVTLSTGNLSENSFGEVLAIVQSAP
jgi:shikimate kinase